MGEWSFSKPDQLGMVVRDLARALEFYESLGFGTFEIRPPASYISREVLGRPVPSNVELLRVAIAHTSPVEIELIQPIAEGSHWMEFLKAKGEGLNHLGYYVEDIEAAETELLEGGRKIIYKSEVRVPHGALRCAYFDTDEHGGILLELIQRPRQA